MSWGDYDSKREPPSDQLERKSGSTDFKQCGWCRFASGTHRYNYCIEGHCTLKDPGYSDKEAVKVKWNTPCLWPSKSQSEILHEVESWKYRIREHENAIVSDKEKIKALSKMSTKARHVPDLPEHRAHDHFNLGDRVAVWFDNESIRKEKGKIVPNSKGRWFFGEVKNGYRHHDGYVSYRMIGIGPQKEDFWGMGMAVPTILKYEDYLFFSEHCDEYHKWCKVAYNKSYNGTKLDPVPIDEIEDTVLTLMEKLGYKS